MADSEAPPPTSGGPKWLQGGGAPGASPSSVLSGAPTLRTGTETTRAEELFTARYSRGGITPIPFGIVAIVGMLATWWALGWAEITTDAPDPVFVSEWWVNVFAVLLPSEDVGLGAYSELRLWTAIAIAVATAVAIALWIGRIGGNVRTGLAPFGTLLPILAFPAWWLLPITLGLVEDSSASRSDLLIRLLVGFAILFAQFLLARWPALNRTWRAGQLPYDMASIVLWLPNLIPWSMLYLSSALTVFQRGDDGLGDTTWEPTPAMEDWANWTTRASALGLLVLLVVVSIRQHVGMRRDRLDDQARRLT